MNISTNFCEVITVTSLVLTAHSGCIISLFSLPVFFHKSAAVVTLYYFVLLLPYLWGIKIIINNMCFCLICDVKLSITYRGPKHCYLFLFLSFS